MGWVCRLTPRSNNNRRGEKNIWEEIMGWSHSHKVGMVSSSSAWFIFSNNHPTKCLFIYGGYTDHFNSKTVHCEK